MKTDRWLLEGLEMPRQEEIAESNTRYEQDLFDADIAYMNYWRRNRCDRLSAVIDDMIKKELQRRIANDK